MRDDIKNYPGVDSLIDKVLRSFDRELGHNLAAFFAAGMIERDVPSPYGDEAEVECLHTIPAQRLGAFVERLLRGLYFHTYQERVPDGYAITPCLTIEHDQLMRERFGIFLHGAHSHQIAGGAFRYLYAEAEDAPKSSVWLMSLYDRVVMAGTIVEAGRTDEVKARAATL